MKLFRCGDVVPGCTGRFEAPDEEGILAEVAQHARQEHGTDTIPADLPEQVRSRIVTV